MEHEDMKKKPRSLTRSLSVKWVSQSALAVNSCDLWVEWKLVAAVRQTVSPEDVHHVTTESHTVNVMMDLQSYTALRSATQCEQSYGTECTIPAQYSEFISLKWRAAFLFPDNLGDTDMFVCLSYLSLEHLKREHEGTGEILCLSKRSKLKISQNLKYVHRSNNSERVEKSVGSIWGREAFDLIDAPRK